jgi:hypothetical protein
MTAGLRGAKMAATGAASHASYLVRFFCSTLGPFFRPDLPLPSDAARSRGQGVEHSGSIERETPRPVRNETAFDRAPTVGPSMRAAKADVAPNFRSTTYAGRRPRCIMPIINDG